MVNWLSQAWSLSSRELGETDCSIAILDFLYLCRGEEYGWDTDTKARLPWTNTPSFFEPATSAAGPNPVNRAQAPLLVLAILPSIPALCKFPRWLLPFSTGSPSLTRGNSAFIGALRLLFAEGDFITIGSDPTRTLSILRSFATYFHLHPFLYSRYILLQSILVLFS